MPSSVKSTAELRVKVFSIGRDRVLEIPREFEFSGDEAIMRRDGNRLIIEPIARKSLGAVLAELEPLAEDFPPIRRS